MAYPDDINLIAEMTPMRQWIFAATNRRYGPFIESITACMSALIKSTFITDGSTIQCCAQCGRGAMQIWQGQGRSLTLFFYFN